jgi:hypothetical protein
MDGVEPDCLDQAREAGEEASKVKIPVARGRWLGRSLVLELEAAFPYDTSLAEATRATERITEAVMTAISGVAAVTVVPRIAMDDAGEIVGTERPG